MSMPANKTCEIYGVQAVDNLKFRFNHVFV